MNANPNQSIGTIRALGVAVALDDFGSGLSSFGYLRSFTFDNLKLDRSLFAGIAADRRVQSFVQATIAMADASISMSLPKGWRPRKRHPCCVVPAIANSRGSTSPSRARRLSLPNTFEPKAADSQTVPA